MTSYITNITNIAKTVIWINIRILLQSINLAIHIASTPLRLTLHLFPTVTNPLNHTLDALLIHSARLTLLPYHVFAGLFSVFQLVFLQPALSSLAPPKPTSHENVRTSPPTKRVILTPQLSAFRCQRPKSDAPASPTTSPRYPRRPILRIDTQAAEAALGMHGTRRNRPAPVRVEPTPAPVPPSRQRHDEGYNSAGSSNNSGEEIEFPAYDHEAAVLVAKKKRAPRNKRLHPSKKLFAGRLPVGMSAEQKEKLIAKSVIAAC